jgi:regulatory protein
MSQDHFQQEPDEKRILSTLLRYCNGKERSKREVKQKLVKLGVTKDDQQKYIDRLVDDKFLDEARYVEMFVRGHLRLNWGKSKIAYALRMRGINKTLVEKAFQSVNPTSYNVQVEVLAERKWNSLSTKAKPERVRKTVDFLRRKGFEFNLANEAVKKLLNKKP